LIEVVERRRAVGGAALVEAAGQIGERGLGRLVGGGLRGRGGGGILRRRAGDEGRREQREGQNGREATFHRGISGEGAGRRVRRGRRGRNMD